MREAAAKINEIVDKLDILINNAGIMACPFAKTVDGIESQFGTNYIGHFLLTNLIMPKILAAGPGSRIVNVSSVGYFFAAIVPRSVALHEVCDMSQQHLLRRPTSYFHFLSTRRNADSEIIQSAHRMSDINLKDWNFEVSSSYTTVVCRLT